MSLNAFAEEPRLDFDKLWDYQKPAETEQKFRALLPQAKEKGQSYIIQLQTQIARTLSLQGKYADAYKNFDQSPANAKIAVGSNAAEDASCSTQAM